MGYIISIMLAYLLGCSNMAYYLAKAKKVDLHGGSGNPLPQCKKFCVCNSFWSADSHACFAGSE